MKKAQKIELSHVIFIKLKLLIHKILEQINEELNYYQSKLLSEFR